MNEDKSTQLRLLVAVLLSIAVMAVWGLLFPPPKPAPQTQAPMESGQAPAGATKPTPIPSGPAAKAPAPATPAVSPAKPVAPRAAAEEKTIVVENDLYRVEFSNRGGVVRSWQLKKYKDNHKPPRTLDVVHPDAAQQLGTWPLSLALDNTELEAQANGALYEVTLVPIGSTPAPTESGAATASLRAPAELTFTWSDGRLAVTKRLKLSSSYIVELDSEVSFEGKPLAHAIAWRGGFGDDTVYAAPELVRVMFRTGGKTQALDHKKLGNPDNRSLRWLQEGTFAYAGIEDRYFAAVFLPRAAGPGGIGAGVALWHWKLEREAVREKKQVKEPVAEIAAGTSVPGPVGLRLYVGPKDLEELGKITPPLTDLVDFGWFGIIARPLFYSLKWLYRYVHNYGWAIVLMTIVINTLLFPLKVKSWRSMQKMQKVQPEIKAIQEKYKKYSARDPRKQEMNKDVMAIYKREGVSPMGGCLPMLLQMPIWFALYQMLNATIELRHAPWIFWIRDLSAQDPYYILPILMTVTMFWMQKMTPTTTTDPMQQKMMNLMPLFFGVLFLKMMSGLVLYILTSNLIGIAQQGYLNRTASATAPEHRGKEKEKRK